MIHVQSSDSLITPHQIRKDMGMVPNGLTDALRGLLADTVSFYLRAHGYHWNVTGPDFSQYHSLFADIYEDVYGSVDPIAENIRKLGGIAPFRLIDFMTLRTLNDDVSPSTEPFDMAANLAAANDTMIAVLNNAFAVANSVNEQGIANFLAERIDQHKKWAWQLKASVS